jgi:dihydrodipicolinate synthase/N-acetylneuraminate lyase
VPTLVDGEVVVWESNTILRYLCNKLGKAVIYIKATDYIHPDTLGKLVEERRVAAIKYAAVRPDPADDPYLEAVAKVVPPSLLVSGIGERPAIEHMRDFGLVSFTSGSVCVAPRSSMKLLRLLGEKRYSEAEQVRNVFIPLEDCRDSISPIRVLHDAVTLAGIADMGPMLPLSLLLATVFTLAGLTCAPATKIS